MIKIIKRGSPKTVLYIFTCGGCDTEFSAEREDVKEDEDIYCVVHNYKCKCPVCGNDVYTSNVLVTTIESGDMP